MFVRELQGDLRKVFSSHVDLNVVRTRHWSRAIPPATRQKQEVTKIETHKKLQCRCRAKEGRKCTEFFSQNESEALRHDDDDFQRVSDVRNSFPEFGSNANSC